MVEMLMKDFELKFPGKAYLTIEEVAVVLDCTKRVVYNWIRRPDIKKRPPFFQSGKWIRFNRNLLVQWLISGGHLEGTT